MLVQWKYPDMVRSVRAVEQWITEEVGTALLLPLTATYRTPIPQFMT